jgi:hypothetical protein
VGVTEVVGVLGVDVVDPDLGVVEVLVVVVGHVDDEPVPATQELGGVDEPVVMGSCVPDSST